MKVNNTNLHAAIFSVFLTLVVVFNLFTAYTTKAAAAEDVQTIVTEYSDLWTGTITVTAGVPVKWYVHVPEETTLLGCAATIKIPGLGWGTDTHNKNKGHLSLTHGTQLVYEFTPTEPGDILFTCWMGSGCHHNYIHVIESEDPSYESEDSSYESEDSSYESEDPSYESEDPSYESEDSSYESEDPSHESEEHGTSALAAAAASNETVELDTAPDTGDNRIPLLFAVLLLSGSTVLVFRKQNCN